MDYDGSVLIDRKLTDEETRELRIVLLPYFHASGGLGVEDITDFLDFAFEMISNKQTVEYVVKEMIGLGMDFCTEDVAHKVGKEISSFLTKLNNPDKGEEAAAEAEGEEDGEGGGSNRVVSLKASFF